jgi:hypothetical protein
MSAKNNFIFSPLKKLYALFLFVSAVRFLEVLNTKKSKKMYTVKTVTKGLVTFFALVIHTARCMCRRNKTSSSILPDDRKLTPVSTSENPAMIPTEEGTTLSSIHSVNNSSNYVPNILLGQGSGGMFVTSDRDSESFENGTTTRTTYATSPGPFFQEEALNVTNISGSVLPKVCPNEIDMRVFSKALLAAIKNESHVLPSRPIDGFLTPLSIFFNNTTENTIHSIPLELFTTEKMEVDNVATTTVKTSRSTKKNDFSLLLFNSLQNAVLGANSSSVKPNMNKETSKGASTDKPSSILTSTTLNFGEINANDNSRGTSKREIKNTLFMDYEATPPASVAKTAASNVLVNSIYPDQVLTTPVVPSSTVALSEELFDDFNFFNQLLGMLNLERTKVNRIF